MHRITSIVIAALVAGCQAHGVTAPDDIAVPESPSAWTIGAEGESTPARWWIRFGDPGLDALMTRVEADNLSLKQAWARLDAARAEAVGVDAGWWPALEARVSASRQRSAQFGTPVDITRYQAGLAARYEIDAWGRVAALTDAAGWAAEASRLDLEALGMSLSASVADAWFELAGQRELARLLTAQIERNQAVLERLEQRFAQGLTTSVAVAQQRGALLSTRSALPPVKARIDALSHRLARLSGRAPGAELPTPGPISDAPALPATGIPGDVMRRRPDLQAARYRAAAADALVGAALAERFPTFALSASIGTGGPTPSALIEQWLWSLAAELVGPIIDGGRRAAVVEQRKAGAREALAAVGEAWLGALGEVEGALSSITHQQARLDALKAQAENDGTLVDEVEARYLAGLGDYLPVVSALRGHQASQRALLSARVEMLRLHVALHRAVGGGWGPTRPADSSTSEDGP